MAWTAYNLVLLGAAVSVASEAKQVRVTHRIAMRIPATLLMPDGTTVSCTTSDYSTGGLGLNVPPGLKLATGDALSVCVSRGDRLFHFPVHASRVAGPAALHGTGVSAEALTPDRHLGVQFDNLTFEQERQLVQCTFGRADAWLNWHERTVEDAPLAGLKEVLLMGIEGYSRLLKGASRALRALLALDRVRY